LNQPRNIFLLAACLCVAIIGVMMVNNSCIYTPDSARYLIWAKSIAGFDGYKDLTHPEPSRYVVHAPLYAVLIAPVVGLFSYNIIAVKIATLCFGILALILLYLWIAQRVGHTEACIACLLAALNPLLIVYSTEVLSDIPFAAALLLTMILFERMETKDPRPWLVFGASVSITAAILLRELGFALLFMAIGAFIIRKQWKQAAMISIFPAAMYGIWYIRNEFMIAPLESPDITNARLFAHHFYTLPGASMASEIIARITNNVSVYAGGVGKLLFAPFYKFMQYDIVFLTHAPLSTVYTVLDGAVYPVMIITVVSCIAGFILDVRGSRTALHRILFLMFYLGIVLIYPVNDIRFMIPLLLLMIYYVALCLAYIFREIPRRDNPSLLLRWSPAALLSLLLIPNAVWDAQFVSNSASYRASPLGFYQSTIGLQRYPSHFTMPFDLAGRWLAEHSDSSSVILSQWKDLACWTGGRKVYTADNTLPLEEMENIIRDYGVRYAVVVVQKNGVREFEVQMLLSRKYAFTQVERFANVEIMRIERKELPAPNVDVSTLFTRGITMLDRGQYPDAASLLDSAYRIDEQNMPALFYSAVAHEFNGDLAHARDLFSSIGLRPQSLVFLNEAAVHQQLIAELGSIGPPAEDRGERYVRAGARYWNLGYHTRARGVNRMALQGDSAFFPALIFGIHFAVTDGDTAEAKEYLARAARTRVDTTLTENWKNILSTMDAVKKAKATAARSQYCTGIGNAFFAMGLIEPAIDNAMLALAYDPQNVEALKLLAHLYQKKRRFSPARTVLERAAVLEPQNAAIAKELSAVLAHF